MTETEALHRVALMQRVLLAVICAVGIGYRLTRGEIEDLRRLADWPLDKLGGVIMYYEAIVDRQY
jgi:hypothetical protein